MSLHETRDRALLERLLRDPALGGPTWAGYALADLDDAVFPRTRWLLTADERALLLVLLWGEAGATSSVCPAFASSVPLLRCTTQRATYGSHEPKQRASRSLRRATVMTFGAFDPALLRAARLPARFDLHAREAQAAEVEALVTGPLPRYVRLGLLRDDLRPLPPPPGLSLARLGLRHVDAARALYAHYPGNVFDPARVTSGPYLGAWDGARLVAVAGTHVASTRTRAAALGDVVTHPERRGQGVGAWLTAALCARLLEDAEQVVLNVDVTNVAALRAYERVGFGARPRRASPTARGRACRSRSSASSVSSR